MYDTYLKLALTELVWDNTPVLAADMDTGEILIATSTAEDMFGYMRGEMRDLCVDCLAPAAKRAEHVQYRQAFSLSPSPRILGLGRVLEGCRKDGTVFPVEVALIPTVAAGKRIVVAILHDMSRKEPQ